MNNTIPLLLLLWSGSAVAVFEKESPEQPLCRTQAQCACYQQVFAVVKKIPMTAGARSFKAAAADEKDLLRALSKCRGQDAEEETACAGDESMDEQMTQRMHEWMPYTIFFE